MIDRRHAWLKLVFAWLAALALTPVRGQTVEELCANPDGRTDDERVRIAWTDVAISHADVRVSYCVLRGEPDAKLTFERNAEIVYFALSAVDRKVDRRVYTFAVKTSAGRTIRQGPADLKPATSQRLSCRVDVCQFFTDPGERVVSVGVETLRRR